MKKFVLYIIMTSFIFICTFQSANAAENKKQSQNYINSMEEDVTGDGIREYIKLHGYLLSDQSNYYTDVWIDIDSLFTQHWKISLHGGYSPKLELYDLTHNNTMDLFYESKIDEKKERYQYQLYSLENGKIQQINLPKITYFNGEFQNDFQIKLKLNPNEKAVIENLSNKKSFYMKHQLFDKKGNLLKKQSLKLLRPIKMEPKLISRSKGYGLTTTQQVRGINEHDIIGHIETLWYYRQNNWIKLKSKWILSE